MQSRKYKPARTSHPSTCDGASQCSLHSSSELVFPPKTHDSTYGLEMNISAHVFPFYPSVSAGCPLEPHSREHTLGHFPGCLVLLLPFVAVYTFACEVCNPALPCTGNPVTHRGRSSRPAPGYPVPSSRRDRSVATTGRGLARRYIYRYYAYIEY